MDLKLSDDQRMIRDSADSLLADIASSSQTRAAMEAVDGFDPQTWQRIGVELGWCGIPIAEVHGGLGLGAAELVQLFEPMGRHLLCAPYFATVALAAPVLIAASSNASCQQWLKAIAEGRLRATAPMLDVAAVARYAPGGATRHERVVKDRVLTAGVYASRDAAGCWRLDGQIDRLIDGATAGLLLLPAQIEDGRSAWFAVSGDQPGLSRRALDGWDRTRRFARVELVAVEAQRIDTPECASGMTMALATARLCLAAEQLGGAQACLDLSVAYTATRKQFGRSIAGFQAVKHRCAEMMVGIEALRSTVYGAAALLADAPDSEAALRETSLTLALAKDTYFHCAQEAIQLHGGVGFTWEYDPQLHLKRAQAGSHWMGTAVELRTALADELMA